MREEPSSCVHRCVGRIPFFCSCSVLVGPRATVGGSHPILSAATVPPNAIQRENAKPGTTEWKLTTVGYGSGAIEGYASVTSVNRGGRIKLFVNTAAPTFTLDIFRMGYYGGLGARRMLNTVTLPGRAQVIPPPDPITGLVECNWLNPFVLDIPNDADPTVWMSGIYVAKLTESLGHKQQYIVFTVRDDGRFSDLIMAQTVNTYQAYNAWGGKSLYGTLVNRTDTVNKAVKVSFDRPYYYDPGQGAGSLFEWDTACSSGSKPRATTCRTRQTSTSAPIPTSCCRIRSFSRSGTTNTGRGTCATTSSARAIWASASDSSPATSYWQVRYENSVVNNLPARTTRQLQVRLAAGPDHARLPEDEQLSLRAGQSLGGRDDRRHVHHAGQAGADDRGRVPLDLHRHRPQERRPGAQPRWHRRSLDTRSIPSACVHRRTFGVSHTLRRRPPTPTSRT